MQTRIHILPLGSTNCFVLQAESAILIDAGGPKKAGKFRRDLDKLGLSPSDIKLIVLTHGHFDHIGSAREIRDLTAARIAMHGRDKETLEKGVARIPPGVTAWGRALHGVLSLAAPLIRFPAAPVDIVLEDESFSLADFGIPGKIIPTPGHSRGSVSVVLESGEAFVGDMAMSGLPLRLSPGLPIFAEDVSLLKKSWETLLALEVKMLYPSHGRPLHPGEMRKALVR